MFCHQQPDTGKVSTDLIRQQLTYTPLDAVRVTGYAFMVFATNAYLDLLWQFILRM
jgi:hypothetical protein